MSEQVEKRGQGEWQLIIKGRWSLMFRQSKVELRVGRLTIHARAAARSKGNQKKKRNCFFLRQALSRYAVVSRRRCCNLHPQVIRPRDNPKLYRKSLRIVRWFRFCCPINAPSRLSRPAARQHFQSSSEKRVHSAVFAFKAKVKVTLSVVVYC